ncbi:hypothetical protein D3C78_1109380 [compost metagenome]
MAGHHVHAQQLAGVDHVLGLGPQRRGRALPGVAAVEQQGAGARSPHALDQRGQVGKAADLAVALGGDLEVQVAEGMGAGRARLQAHGLEQMLAHQMGGVVLHRAQPQVDAGLAEINGLELGVAVRHVQQRHIAESRQLVEGLVGQRRVGVGIALQAHARNAGRGQHLQEFAFGEAHISVKSGPRPRAGRGPRFMSKGERTKNQRLTGDLGSSSKAMTSRTWASPRMAEWPKRGMPEQAL